jgi:hypothetical protein
MHSGRLGALRYLTTVKMARLYFVQPGDVILKIANGHKIAISGMCAVISVGIEVGTGQPAQPTNLHKVR